MVGARVERRTEVDGAAGVAGAGVDRTLQPGGVAQRLRHAAAS